MSVKNSLFNRRVTLNFRGRLKTIDRPWVMGILNLTPDSFHDGGRINSVEDAVHQAEKMLNEGADVLDIGAYSSRPGAEHIPVEEELLRLLPALRGVRRSFPEALLSVDTFRSEVARAALDEGVDVINDISGGLLDPMLPSMAARAHAPYVCMHMPGTPQTMQQHLNEGPIMPELLKWFAFRLEELRQQGLHDVIIDPGFGFGKMLAQNYEVARSLDAFALFERPILVGISRKSMVQKAAGVGHSEALNGTTALHTALLQRGADILRVHDVKEAVECVRIHQAIMGLE